MERILIIGGAGYVGSMLTAELVSQNYEVRVLDTFWYGSKHLKNLNAPNLELIQADMRDTSALLSTFKNVDSVIHLACISNDPSFDLDPKLGRSINLESFEPLLEIANNSSARKFIYASSSSVYGIRNEEKITEDLSLAPLTDYSKFKAECEDILFNQARDGLTTTVLRPATVCGYSSRQRFDLVVNILTANAIVNRKLKVFGGTQYRPNLHIKDMVSAYIEILTAPIEKVDRQIFNVGSKNLTVSEIAQAVKIEINPDLPIEYIETNDPRSYRIDSSKIKEALGFEPKYSVNNAVTDIRENFKTFKTLNPLEDSRFINILRMKELNLG